MPSLQDIQIAIAKQDFLEFLHFVKILGVAGSNSGGVVDFEMWPHLVEIVALLEEPSDRRIAWLKARQIGCTWVVSAWTLWRAMYHEGTIVVEFAEKEDKAKEIIRKQKFIYTHLPPELQVPVKTLDNQLTIEFPGPNSSITAYPSTADAAIGLTTSIVWFDEFDFHQYGAEALEATAPLVNDTGGKIILTSTSNPETAIQGSAFKTLFSQAEQMHWRGIFYGWWARPDRDQEWYDENYEAAVDKYAFVKHYPSSANEALSPPANYVAFDYNALDEMKQFVREPIETRGLANIYQRPIRTRNYVAATDTSHGVGGDYSVTVVLDCTTGYVVADVMSNAISPEELADVSVELLTLYHSPLWAIEDNDWGRATVMRSLELGYSNLYYRKEDQPGWHTTVANRWPAWSELIEAINQVVITIPNAAGLEQFYSVIRNPAKQGRIEALQGQNDDYPMAMAICWQMRKEQSAYSLSQKPITIRRWR